ncbi:MAG: hypothetical protein ABI305_05245 [Tepidiformaceae bacterium]
MMYLAAALVLLAGWGFVTSWHWYSEWKSARKSAAIANELAEWYRDINRTMKR